MIFLKIFAIIYIENKKRGKKKKWLVNQEDLSGALAQPLKLPMKSYLTSKNNNMRFVPSEPFTEERGYPISAGNGR